MTSSQGSLQQEIRQTKPFGSKAKEAALALLRTIDMMKRSWAEILEPHGVTLQQYNVLRILRGAEPDGLRTLAIADRMVERAPGITRMLDRLERKGWIGRTRGVDDRRSVSVRISPAGLALLAGLDAEIEKADEYLAEILTDAELATFIDQLDRIRAAYRTA